MASSSRESAATTAARLSVRGLAVMAVIGMAGHGLAMTITGPVLPDIMRTFAFKETAAGILLAAGSLGFMIGCLIGGFVTDQLGLKPVMLAAWVGVVASLVGFSLSRSYALLVVTYGLIGAASGVVETGLNVLPTQLGAGAGLMNVVHMGYGIGAMSAPLIDGAVLERGGAWWLPYWLIAIVPAVLAVRALTMRMPSAPRHSEQNEEHQSIWVVLRQPLVVLSAVALLFYVAGELCVSNWIVLFVSERFVLSPFTASLALSTFWAAILIGRLLQGPLNARVSLPGLIVASGVLFGSGVLLLALAPVPSLAYVGLAVAGLGAAGIYPDVMIFANRRYPRQIGAVTGVLSTAAAAGSFAFQPIVGRVAEVWSLQLGFIGLAGCIALMVVAYLPIWLGKVR